MLKRDGVRGLGPGIKGQGWYVKWSPQVGFSVPWFNGFRLRWARHHGLQKVVWIGRADGTAGRWYVRKQILGRSKVKGERYSPPRERIGG